MQYSMASSLPSFGAALRLAGLGDVPRLGIVGSAGFYHSVVSAYERPDRDLFPADTVADYREQLQKSILDPARVLIVARDTLEPEENDKTYEALRPISKGVNHVSDDGKLVVGFVSLILAKGSSRIGQFQPEGERFLSITTDSRSYSLTSGRW